MAKRNERLQSLCRGYLRRLRHLAYKHGIDVDALIAMNRRNECEATLHEVEMLARCVDDSRLSRVEVPRVVGKPYQTCNNDGTFDKIKKLPKQGIYSKVSALLYNDKK